MSCPFRRIRTLCARFRACLALLIGPVLVANIGGSLSDRVHPSLPSIRGSVASAELMVSVIHRTNMTGESEDRVTGRVGERVA